MTVSLDPIATTMSMQLMNKSNIIPSETSLTYDYEKKARIRPKPI